MEGRLYLRLVVRHWLPTVVILIVSVIAGSLLYALSPSSYESKSSFIVQANSSSTSPAERYQGELLAQTRAQEYGQIVPGPTLAALLSERLDGVTSERVQADVTPSIGETSTVLNVSVRDESAAVAEDIARVLAEELPGYVAQLDSSPSAPATVMRVLAPPSAAERVAPTPTSSLGLALLGGLVLSFSVAIVRELANRRVRDVDDVRAVVGQAPVGVDGGTLGRRWVGPAADRALVPLSVVLRSAAARNRPIAVVPVSSPPVGAGWVLALARHLSSTGQRIGLVDADLQGRALSSAAAADPPPAVDSGTRGSVEVVSADAVAAVAGGGGGATAASAEAPDPFAADLITSALAKVVAEVGERADVVVVLTGGVLLTSRPPLLPARDTGVVLVVERNRTRKEELGTAVEVVHELGSEVGAVVVVGGPSRSRPR